MLSARSTVAYLLSAATVAFAQAGVTYDQNYPLGGSVNGEYGGSLSANPTVANADLTHRGSDWLWAAFAVILASGIGVLAWGLSRPVGTRAFHWIGVMILFTASVAYFSLASDLGATAVYVEFVRYKGDLFTNRAINPYTRSIWYVRYIDWCVTTPLLLLELLLTTGLPLGDIIITIFFDLVMIIGGLIGALVPSSYKWGYFTGACVAEIFITYMLLVPARKSAKAMGPEAVKAYTSSAIVLSALWFLYPVCWGLADGGNVISTDSEMVFYGVLDVIAKPCFLIFHLFSIRNIDYQKYQLQSGHYSAYGSAPTGDLLHVNENRTGMQMHEKRAPAAKSVPAGNGAVAAGNNGLTPHGATNTGTLPGQMHVANNRASDVTAV